MSSLKRSFIELEKFHFFYIHKSYFVNYFYVKEFGHKELTMSNNSILPISQLRRNEVKILQIKYENGGI